MRPGYFQYRLRRLHRFLGVTLGIQLLLWTLGGLYFSWSNMDAVHGDYQKKETPRWPDDLDLVNPTLSLRNLKERVGGFELIDLRLVRILARPFYQIIYQSKSSEGQDKKAVQLADARTGELRPMLSEAEALALAQERFNGNPVVRKTEYLTDTGGHHEYRESPLPAYAFTFDHPTNTTVYVAAELGTVQSFRNDRWRVFDFLWMLHTMDYQARDNISNWLLRLFSIFGLVTVCSGFALYLVTTKKMKRVFPLILLMFASWVQAAAQSTPMPDPVAGFPNYHPMIVHFPIGLLVLAAFMQVAGLFIKSKGFHYTILIFAALGYATAYFAAAWRHPQIDREAVSIAAQLIFDEHQLYARWSVYLGGAGAVLKAVELYFQRRRLLALLTTLVLGAAATVIGISGHHGAELVHKYGIGPRGDFYDRRRSKDVFHLLVMG
jgi:uncharacterized membrane protein